MKTLKRLGVIVVVLMMLLVGVTSNDQGPTAAIQHVRMLPSKQMVLPKQQATVFIDAGHGDVDSGMIPLSGMYEKEINLDIALRIGEILKENGVNVAYSRTSDVQLSTSNVDDLQSRIDLSVVAKADLFVSIHCNASEYGTRKGFEVYTDPNDVEAFSLSKIIEEKLEEVNYTDNNGIVDATELLHLVIFAEVPTTLVEIGYLDHADDNAFIQTETGRQQIAAAIANGILTKIHQS